MFEQLVDWIKQNYNDARKIIEIGVGHRIDVAERISKALPQVEILVTDKDESWVRSGKLGRIRAIADDVMFPSLKLYQGASLVYCLHPPGEIVPGLEKLANGVGADLLIVPISDEGHDLPQDKWRELVVNGRIVGWLLSDRTR
ncbi:MAG: hypothetical protein AUI50_01945 [Crenarchaeota archaeon 13_1_40CM_2_52_14]|nr:MAG: hypothetical protein AUI97_06100 [Crenarchaeota archaeon 13_1_40CM_3_52_17]OLD35485.1 MAG: hypothetical protein AUI50_01945 [Crenarchaeota archaeon 13_1_40CM_2_52_14]OLE70626.1 MAG: hypothetical protein AUF78_05770 [archaeon 13_1_20CM_2_51_12]